uniref:Uncharacterized protein n=1 Tax=Oryza meridionalis TaxID=40149 RepID=A0A0E0CP58_9ORYZ
MQVDDMQHMRWSLVGDHCVPPPCSPTCLNPDYSHYVNNSQALCTSSHKDSTTSTPMIITTITTSDTTVTTTSVQTAVANASVVTCFWPLPQTHHRFGVGVERDKRDGKGQQRAGPSEGGSRCSQARGKIEEIVKKAVLRESREEKSKQQRRLCCHKRRGTREARSGEKDNWCRRRKAASGVGGRELGFWEWQVNFI